MYVRLGLVPNPYNPDELALIYPTYMEIRSNEADVPSDVLFPVEAPWNGATVTLPARSIVIDTLSYTLPDELLSDPDTQTLAIGGASVIVGVSLAVSEAWQRHLDVKYGPFTKEWNTAPL